MTNKNGRAARPKTAAMVMGGEIGMALSEASFAALSKGEAVVIDSKGGPEFIVQLELGAAVDQVQSFAPWFWVKDARVTVENSAATDDELGDSMEVIVHDGADRSFGFLVSAAQAEALASTLSRYAQAWRAFEALKAEQPTA